jgi:hypothetical protein
MFRKGYIKKGAPVVHEERTMADLWNRREPLIAEDKSFDPNRDTGSSGAKNNLKSEVNPLAFLVGPVQVKYGGDPTKTRVADLKPFINESAKTIRSNTGSDQPRLWQRVVHGQHTRCSGCHRLSAEVPLRQAGGCDATLYE